MHIVPIDQNAPAPGSMVDYALKYAALGWHVFPVWGAHEDGRCRCGRLCKSPGKHPVERLVPRGQDDATTDPATIRRWWAAMPYAGIAVNLKLSGLCAIDIDPRNGGIDTIDSLEAEHGPLASDVMAFTQGGGEHRIFKLAENVSLPGKLGHGVDLKRNGYIVLAPTRGPNGVYGWEASSDPLEGCIPSPLPDWIRSLAHEITPAAANTPRLVTPEQIDELRSALSAFPSDDRDMWIKVGMALYSIGQAGYDLWCEWSKKSAKFDSVDQIRTWRSFKPGSINYETVFFIAQEHGWINPLSGSTLSDPVPVETVQPARPIANDHAIPEHLLNPPGILGQVTQWLAATSRKPQPQFDVQAAIAFCSTVMGRRWCTTQRNWPSLYLLNIGKSASGKEHAKWAIEQLLDACGLTHLIGPAGYTSNAGVLSALSRQPSHISIIDEFGKALEAASIKHSARAASAMTALMETWGRCDGTLRPQGYSTFGLTQKDIEKLEERSVRNPALTLLAMTTPESFFETIGTAAARDGFLNRFLIVESCIGRQPGKPAKNMPVPQSVIDWAKYANAHDGLANPDASASLIPVSRIIHFDDDASALFADFERECIMLMDNHDRDGLAEMFGRTNEIAMRLSMVVAVGCGRSSIARQDALWAIDYARHYAIRTVDRIKTSVADSEFEAIKKQVLDLIRKTGERGMTERDLNKSSRKFAAMDKRGQINVLESLAFAGDVQRCEMPSIGGRGTKRLAWVAIATDD